MIFSIRFLKSGMGFGLGKRFRCMQLCALQCSFFDGIDGLLHLSSIVVPN